MNPRNYIGIPYLSNGRTHKGVDCWGLVYLIYSEILNINLPEITTEYTNGLDVTDTKDVFLKYEKIFKDQGDFRTVEKTEPYDLLLFKRSEYISHVAIVVDDAFFIHASVKSDSCMEQWQGQRTGSS